MESPHGSTVSAGAGSAVATTISAVGAGASVACAAGSVAAASPASTIGAGVSGTWAVGVAAVSAPQAAPKAVEKSRTKKNQKLKDVFTAHLLCRMHGSDHAICLQ
jgi:hypothetical protein